MGQGYSNEAALQQLLADNPQLIPSVAPDAKVCRELYSSAGYADLVVMSPGGDLTLVECKLAANPQVRREVVAQALDYASRLWRMSVEEFQQAWTASTGLDPFEDDAELRDVVAANLRDARLTLVMAVDGINDELRRIVEFLNEITVTETAVIAVEYLRYEEGELEILRPRSYGAELAQTRTRAGTDRYDSRRRWALDELIAWTDTNDPGALGQLNACLDAWRDEGWKVAGGRALEPSANVSRHVRDAGERWPFVLYCAAGRGLQLEIRFGDLKQWPDLALGFATAAAEHLDLPISLDDIVQAGFAKRPRILLSAQQPTALSDFIQAVTLASSSTAWHCDARATALVEASDAWTRARAAIGPDDLRSILDQRLHLYGRSWPDEASCRSAVFANHAGGLPVDVAEALVHACAPSAGTPQAQVV